MRKARVLPGDAVDVIDQVLPWVKDSDPQGNSPNRGELRSQPLGMIQGILRLIGRIPEELLAGLGSSDRCRFTLAETALRDAIVHSERGWPRLTDNTDCLKALRDILTKCPDQPPSESSKELTFIEDKAFRATLGMDLGSAERALASGEWKTATVLAASVAEALLLWAIKQHSTIEISAAINNASVNRNLPANNLTSREWAFHAYIEAARELDEIDERTTSRCRDAKDYRNLIHAGAAEREREECNRATAHGALCAVYAVIKDLEERHTVNAS